MFIFNESKGNILCERLLESEKHTVTDLYLFLDKTCKALAVFYELN